MIARLKLAGIEQHDASPNDRKCMRQLKVVEDGALGNYVFEQRAQVGNIPLAVAQLVNQVVLCFFRRDVKGLVKGAVGGVNAQRGIENQERLAHRVYDVLGVRFNGLQVRLGASPLRHIFHGQHQQLPVMARLKLAGIEQHYATPDDREVCSN